MNKLSIVVAAASLCEIPAKRQIVHSRGVSFVRIPVYDSPCILTDRRVLAIQPL